MKHSLLNNYFFIGIKLTKNKKYLTYKLYSVLKIKNERMLNMKKVLLGVVSIFLGIGGAFLYHNVKNIQNLSSDSIDTDSIIQAIHSSEIDISLKDSIKQAELVAKVTISKKIKELNSNDDTAIPKTVHLAKISSVLKGEAIAGSEINILQDGIEDMLVNGIPIYQSGENYIFILNKALPEKDFPNTYWAKKAYFEADEQLISLNYGEQDSMTELKVEATENEIVEKLDSIIESTPVDSEAISILDKEKTYSVIEEVVENDEK